MNEGRLSTFGEMASFQEHNNPLISIEEEFLSCKGVKLYILREDLIHPKISGNKWRKLKYNLVEAKSQEQTQLLTFGGAYSNHIAAVAAASKEHGLGSIGVIRGEETLPFNSTLRLAKDNGMKLHYVSREKYIGDSKYDDSFLKELTQEFGEFYMIPEGGSNSEAVKGCTEILNDIDVDYDIVCAPCGTGGTLAGIIASIDDDKKVLGFPALKGGDFLEKDIRDLIDGYSEKYSVAVENKNWELMTDYHFGGYAKVKPALIEFIQDFKQSHDITLDLIYTGKMLFGLYDIIKNTSQLDQKTIIAVHTGGVQGNKGFEERLNITI